MVDEAELLLGAIVASSDDAIVSKDLGSIIRSWNPGAERLFGYSADEVIGKSIRLIIPPELQHEEDTVLSRIRSGQRVDHFETVRLRKDGSRVPVSLTVSPVHGPDGSIIGASKIARDITGQKWSHAQVQGERRALALLATGAPLPVVLEALTDAFEGLGDGLIASILLVDGDGTRLRHAAAPHLPARYNQAVDGLPIGPVAGSCGTAAYRGEPVVVADIATDELWAAEPKLRDLALECGLHACWSTPIKAIDGSVLGTFALYFPTPRAPDGELLDFAAHMAFNAATIIERKRADESRARLTAIINSSNDAIIGASREGVIQTWNPGAQRLYGYTEAEMLGRNLETIIPSEYRQQFNEGMTRALAGHDVPAFDTARIHKEGHLVEVSVQYSPIRNENGEVIGVSSIARDISQRREVERLQREFLAMVTHELRNPLTSIRGYASILKRSGAFDAEAVDTMLEQSLVLERLISDLLDASRVQVGRLDLNKSTIDLVEIAFSCARQVQTSTTRHRIRVETEVPLLEGHWDEVRIEQVLTNLLTNAVKYSPGGEIVVRVEEDGENARLSVRDHGVGIDNADLPHLFDRFYRVKGAGHSTRSLGLGLYICRAIVEMHEGRIRAESPGRGQGSVFVVELPRRVPAQSEKVSIASPSS